jgi:lipopolysaccharide/colanic/teichoic acid biosynthesis glycosyltransferase
MDMVVSTSVLIAFSIPMLIIGLCVRLTSTGNALFSQNRVGLGGEMFRIYKFRSMTENNGGNPRHGLTKQGDLRVTPFGRFIRRFKLDEFPQLFNVLHGEMSMVGPRPKLPQYAEIMNLPYRPGITGPATIAFRREEELLQHVDPADMDRFYDERIKPLKARLDICYMCKATPLSDLRMIAATVFPSVAVSSASAECRKIAKRSAKSGSSAVPELILLRNYSEHASSGK